MCTVANPEGFINNSLKKGTVKDVTRLCYSLSKTYHTDTGEALQEDEKDSLRRLLKNRDGLFMLVDTMPLAQQVYEVMFGDRNKVTVGPRSYIIENKPIEPTSNDNTYHISHLQAPFLLQYLVLLYAKLAKKRVNPDTDYAICAPQIIESFRLVTIPKNMSHVFSVNKTQYAGIPLTLMDRGPRGYGFIEFSCLKDGWNLASGVHISERCDIFIDDDVLTVRICILTEPFIEEEVSFVKSVLKQAELIFQGVYDVEDKPVVQMGKRNGDLVTFTYTKPPPPKKTSTPTSTKKTKKKKHGR